MTSSDIEPLTRIANSLDEMVKPFKELILTLVSKPEPTIPLPGEMQAFALGIAKGFAKSLREALDGEHDAFTRANMLRDTLRNTEQVIDSLQKTVDAYREKARKEREEKEAFEAREAEKNA